MPAGGLVPICLCFRGNGSSERASRVPEAACGRELDLSDCTEVSQGGEITGGSLTPDLSPVRSARLPGPAFLSGDRQRVPVSRPGRDGCRWPPRSSVSGPRDAARRAFGVCHFVQKGGAPALRPGRRPASQALRVYAVPPPGARGWLAEAGSHRHQSRFWNQPEVNKAHGEAAPWV